MKLLPGQDTAVFVDGKQSPIIDGEDGSESLDGGHAGGVGMTRTSLHHGASTGRAGGLSSASVAKFDAKLVKIDSQMMETRQKLRVAMKQARRADILKSEITTLMQDRLRAKMERRRRLLQFRLDKQRLDAEEIDRMTDDLREKYNDLRRAKTALKDGIESTVTHIQTLKGVRGAGSVPSLAPIADNIIEDMKISHGQQVQGVGQVHDVNSKGLATMLKDALNRVTAINGVEPEAAEAGSASGSVSGSASTSRSASGSASGSVSS